MVTRRQTLKLIGSGVVASVAAPAVLRAADRPKLIISWWGFNGDNLQKYLVQPFLEKHDAEIIFDTGPANDRFNRIKLRPGTIDLAYFSDMLIFPGIQAGLFEPINRAGIPNIAEAFPAARAPQGEQWGPGYEIQRYGIIYDASKISSPITQWSDLWRPELKRRISLPSIANSIGCLTVLIAGSRVGVDAYADPDKAFNSVAELKPNIVKTFTTGSDVVNLFSQGEIVAAAAQDFTFVSIKKAVPNAKWASLSDGQFANFNTINLVKGTKNAKLAEAFINFHLDKDVQRNLAAAGVHAPVNEKTVLTPEEAAPWAYGQDVISKLRTIDYQKYNSVVPDWTDRWNEVFAK